MKKQVASKLVCEKATVYRTTDGKQFSDRAEAEEHQTEIECAKKSEKIAKDIICKIMEHNGVYENFDEIERIAGLAWDDGDDVTVEESNKSEKIGKVLENMDSSGESIFYDAEGVEERTERIGDVIALLIFFKNNGVSLQQLIKKIEE